MPSRKHVTANPAMALTALKNVKSMTFTINLFHKRQQLQASDYNLCEDVLEAIPSVENQVFLYASHERLRFYPTENTSGHKDSLIDLIFGNNKMFSLKKE
jgi:hypothetical protein